MCLREKNGEEGMVYTLYMYVQKCFQVVYYQPLLLDMF